MTDASSYLSKMLCGKELTDALSVWPSYSSDIRKASDSERLIELSKLYEVYVASSMSTEIYCKLYLALLRSLQKKNTKLAVRQGYENFKGNVSNGIIGGSDSFTLLGRSGIGKSSAINRAISLLTKDNMIVSKDGYTKIVATVTVQTPWDCSIKGLLLEILRNVDEALETDYHKNALRGRATTDALIGSVANVCLNSVGLLIIDEFQNVCGKNGNQLMGTIINLINASGISVALVGTLETKTFFGSASFQLSRRSLGLEYDRLAYDEYFYHLCKRLTSYLYVKNDFVLTDDIVNWLYCHSDGITSVVVSLIRDAQEVAILDGSEVLSITTLNKAYYQRLSLLHNYIGQDSVAVNTARARRTSQERMEDTEIVTSEHLIENAVKTAKKSGGDLLTLLKREIEIIEVTL